MQLESVKKIRTVGSSRTDQILGTAPADVKKALQTLSIYVNGSRSGSSLRSFRDAYDFVCAARQVLFADLCGREDAGVRKLGPYPEALEIDKESVGRALLTKCPYPIDEIMETP